MKKNLHFNWATHRFEMEDGNPKTYADNTAQDAWVEQAIRTDCGALLFPSEYGTTAKDAIGKRMLQSFYKAELERTIKQSCKLNSYIDYIDHIETDSNGEVKFVLHLV